MVAGEGFRGSSAALVNAGIRGRAGSGVLSHFPHDVQNPADRLLADRQAPLQSYDALQSTDVLNLRPALLSACRIVTSLLNPAIENFHSDN